MKRTRNMFTGNYIENTLVGSASNLWISQSIAHDYDGDGKLGSLAIIEVTPSTTYTVKSHDISLTDAFRIGISDTPPTYDRNGRFYLDTSFGLMGDSSTPKREYTFKSGINTHYMYVYVSTGSNKPRLQVEEGGAATEYSEHFVLDNSFLDYEYKLENNSISTETLKDSSVTPAKTSKNISVGKILPAVRTSYYVDFNFKNMTLRLGNVRIQVQNDNYYTAFMADPGVTVTLPAVKNNYFYILYNPTLIGQEAFTVREQNSMTIGKNDVVIGVYNPSTKEVFGIDVYRVDGVEYVTGKNNSNSTPQPNPEIKRSVLPIRSNELHGSPVLESVNSSDSTTKIHTLTSADIYSFYDSLMSAYPNYISKELVTNESSAHALPIYKYTFTPEKPELTRTDETTDMKHFFVVSGVHAGEKAGWWCLYESMKQICENWKDSEVLEDLRWNVKFTILPIVNPYGLDYSSDTVTLNGKKNANGIDINRNFPTGFTVVSDPTSAGYGGQTPLSEPETIAVADILKNANVDYYADLHNFSSNPNTNYFLWNVAGSNFNMNMSQTYLTHLTNKWKKDRADFPQDDNIFFGYSGWFVGGTTPAYVNELGVEGGIFEICHTLHFLSASQYSSDVITLGTEAQINWLYMAYRNLIN